MRVVPGPTEGLPQRERDHLANVAANLQLIADLGYGDAALAVPDGRGVLTIVADARPSTAIDPFAVSRTGTPLTRDEEPEAYATLAGGRRARGERPRLVHGVAYTTETYPIGAAQTSGIVLRVASELVEAATSRMELAFIDAARGLLEALRDGPLLDRRTAAPFATTRRAGDGVLRVDAHGIIAYASPNAVSIMRAAGVGGRVTAMRAVELPGAGLGISPLLGRTGAIAAEAEVAGRVLGYRSIALPADVLVLVEDLTEARRRERELEVKEATIREVHHRVKNNLQTIASLFRIQARRSDSPEVRRALDEAIERAAAMATVHDLLARSEHERVDFAEAARRVVQLVRRGHVGDDGQIAVEVAGETGPIGAAVATPLALALAELVHNALEHAFGDGRRGAVGVVLQREPGRLVLSVRDDGRGLPPGVDPLSAGGLGYSIVRTLVEDDLRGTISVKAGNGTAVTLIVPLPDDEEGEAAPSTGAAR
jgi:two-component sensor histidine kinase